MPYPAFPLGCDSKLDGRRMRYVSPASEHLQAVPRQGFPGEKTAGEDHCKSRVGITAGARKKSKGDRET